jgi:uncharacterized membrane protein YoaK (UPF0700 family)
MSSRADHEAPASGASLQPAAGIALLLAFGAGLADTIAYLALAKTFVANMSGNTAAGAVYLVRGERGQALHRLLPIAGFLAGAALGQAAAEYAKARGSERRLVWVLSLEALVLVAVSWMASSGATENLLAVAMAAAMGIQNAALRRAAGHRVRTTFVSGMLIAFIDEALQLLMNGDSAARRGAWLHAGVFFLFFTGAAGGAAAFSRYGWTALAAPEAVLLLAIATNLTTKTESAS